MVENNHGGRREGAGRKTSLSAKKMVSFRLAPDVLEYLESTSGIKTVVIEDAENENVSK